MLFSDTDFVMEKQFKNKISLEEFEVVNTSSSNVAGKFFGSQRGFNVNVAAEGLKVCVVKMDSLDMKFDLV